MADKALHIDPKNLPALIVKARSFSSAGNVTQAAQILEKVPDLEKGGEPAELLLDLYLKNAKWDEATALALKIFSADEKNFGATQKVTEALLEQSQGERAMSLLSRIRIPMTDAGEHEGVVHLLNELAVRLPERLNRWNGLWILMDAPAIRSVCRMRWRTWAMHWSQLGN